MGEYEGNQERFTGFAELYDRFRYRPPAVLAEMLLSFAGVERPRVVVDLGCGTGISTRLWADRAERVIGVDPSADMRAQARRSTSAKHIEYRSGFGHETGLDDEIADIVTCAQSFHWMEPTSTLAEIRRILRPGGVFAAYNYEGEAPTGIHALDRAAEDTMTRILNLELVHELKKDVRFYGKADHPDHMERFGEFAVVRTIHFGNVEMTSAERLRGGLESLGALQTLRKLGLSDEELGLTGLAAAAAKCIGDREVPAYVSYTVNIGVKPDRTTGSPTTQEP